MRKRRKVFIGIAVMDSKATSKPMHEILERIRAYGEFRIVNFGDKLLLDEIPEEWPLVDCLISFFSKDFPVEKVERYCELHKDSMFLINEVAAQSILRNRLVFLSRRSHSFGLLVYQTLQKSGIRVPKHVVVSRDEEKAGFDESRISEFEDFIEIDGVRIDKPFVEKPLSGEDHNVHIYYSSTQGGGSRRLFRKVKDQSSKYFPNKNQIRRTGSYVYEEFLFSGRDIKVYSVGKEYNHAESRKAPTVDGIVQRNHKGKEVRLIELLTAEEEEFARKVVVAFKQNICGFDLLRSKVDGVIQSYVIDVNGWSFVKGDSNYYNNCARLIRKLCLSSTPAQEILLPHGYLGHSPEDSLLSPKLKNCSIDDENGNILLGVVSVFRHADRTPKEKLKFKSKNSRLLEYFLPQLQSENFSGFKELKLKKKSDLRLLLSIVEGILETEALADINLERMALILKNNFPGLKVQLKPDKKNIDEATKLPESVKIVVKWGGEMTEIGNRQSELYGDIFRKELLRINPEKMESFFHHINVFSSDEDRVKSTAQEFLKGLLNFHCLTGEEDNKISRFDPIVKQNADTQQLLDDTSRAKDPIEIAKDLIKKLFTAETPEDVFALVAPEEKVLIKLLEDLVETPLEKLRTLYELMKEYCKRLEAVPESSVSGSNMYFLRSRWEKLVEDLYDVSENSFDTTKIPDVYDCIRYEMLHNISQFEPDFSDIVQSIMIPLHELSQRLSLIVIPLEYGYSSSDKFDIASLIGLPLLESINRNLNSFTNTLNPSKCHLYFTSESHMHSIRNLIAHGNLSSNPTCRFNLEALDLNYFSHVVFHIYVDLEQFASLGYPDEIPTERCFVRILASGGALDHPSIASKTDGLRVSIPSIVSGHVSLRQLEDLIQRSRERASVASEAGLDIGASSPVSHRDQANLGL